MPDVVIVKERQQDAVSVMFTRLSWSFLPSAEALEEKVQRKAPNDSGEENTDKSETLDPLSTPQLHNDVKCKVQQQVTDGDGQ